MSKPNGQADVDDPAADGKDNSAAGQQSGGPSSRLTTTTSVKCVFVCPNGGRYSKVKKVVIPSRLRNRWDGILRLVDDHIPIFGGCFRLSKVVSEQDFAEVQSFDELEDGEMYVALNGTEKLIKTDYKGLLNSSRSPSPPRRSQQSTASRTKPRQRKGPDVESKFLKLLPRIRITVYANGLYHVKHQVNLDPAEVYERRAQVFKNKICSAMEFVYRDIEDACHITLQRNQSIRKMIDVRDGRLITSPGEIEDNGTYVLCGVEEYKGFDGSRGRYRLTFSKFAPEPTRYLNNPRSAKVGNKSSRREKNQETARDSSRSQDQNQQQQSQQSQRENGYGNDEDDADAYHDPYGQGSQDNDPYNQRNGYDSNQNGNETREDEYNSIPTFGEADAPLLTEGKNQDYNNDEEEKTGEEYNGDSERQRNENDFSADYDHQTTEEAKQDQSAKPPEQDDSENASKEPKETTEEGKQDELAKPSEQDDRENASKEPKETTEEAKQDEPAKPSEQDDPENASKEPKETAREGEAPPENESGRVDANEPYDNGQPADNPDQNG